MSILKVKKYACCDEIIKDSIFKFIKDKINMHNFTFFFKVADVFHMPKLSQTTLHYIERCFKLAVESSNLLNLNFALVRRILCSSELHLTTEIEVFKAANDWIAYRSEERMKFACALLSTVRFHLLSDDALTSILHEKHHICKAGEIRATIVLWRSNEAVERKLP